MTKPNKNQGKLKFLSHKSIWCRRKVCFDTKIYFFCLPKRTNLLHFTSQCGCSLIQGNKKSYLSLSDFSGSGLALELRLHDFFPNVIFSNTLFSNIHFPKKHFSQVYFGLNLSSFRTAFIQIITNREESIRESYFRVKGLDQKLECGEAKDIVVDCSLKKLNNSNFKFLFYSQEIYQVVFYLFYL
jgi:hypothetical protein